jgi:L-cysteine/cystine lyase
MQLLRNHSEQYPALQNKAYFNFGGQGVLAKGTLDTISCNYERVQHEGPFSMKMIDWIIDELRLTRKALAEFLGGRPEGFALTQNVTEGCNIVLWGIEWNAGDRLLITDSEHTGVVAAAQQVARRRNVQIDMLAVRNKSDAEIVATIESMLQPATKLVVLSHVLWNTGQVLPVVDIQQLCRKHGIFLLVDGAQSAGVLPMDMATLDCDSYAITAHKWLCGPEGLGALYVKPELIERLQPTYVGWRGNLVSDPDTHTIENFEIATAPFPLLAAFRKALEIHAQSGTAEDRHAMLMNNVSEMRKQLAEVDGVGILTPPESTSGLVCFTASDRRHGEIVRKLQEQKILLRTIGDPDCVRASVHYLNSEQDIAALTNAFLRNCQ